MSTADVEHGERRRVGFLAPLMIGANAFLFLCMGALCVLTFRGGNGAGIISTPVDPNAQVVKEYIAAAVPSDSYHIREFFPATPLEGSETKTASHGWVPVSGQGFVQRVKLDFYAPGGARPLDIVCWIQHGKVTNCMQSDQFRFAGESVQQWEQRRPRGIQWNQRPGRHDEDPLLAMPAIMQPRMDKRTE
jgi:hypothetical protein